MKDLDSKAGDQAREPGWKERLRAGDPAAEAAPLDPREVAALRRAALEATEEDDAVPRRALFAPYRLGAALAAAGGLAWLVWIGFGGRGGSQTPLPVIEQESASVPAPAPPAPLPPRIPPAPILAEGTPAPAPTSTREPAPAPSTARGARPGSRLHLPPAPDREAVPQLASNPPSPEAAPATTPAEARRELQFSTPGGTRIVWVFASGAATPSTPPLSSRL